MTMLTNLLPRKKASDTIFLILMKVLGCGNSMYSTQFNLYNSNIQHLELNFS